MKRRHPSHRKLGNSQHSSVSVRRPVGHYRLRPGTPLATRAAGTKNLELPFDPPEEWHEPTGDGQGFRVIKRPPGSGYRHVITEAEIRRRLSVFPESLLRNLEVVQLSQMTRKKLCFPCYGMQWGASIYLYPMETDLKEVYTRPPEPAQSIEARMYGGRWEQISDGLWQLSWTFAAIHDYFLNNILIHEFAHLIDYRNTSSRDRERFAEWFAVQFGYKPTRTPSQRKVVPRHRHSKRGL